MSDAPATTRRGRLLRPQHVTRAMLRAAPQTVWAFGDNMARRGMGGQAREMRGEPNAVGVPTKRLPDRTPHAYFSDADWKWPVDAAITDAFYAMEEALLQGRDVAIPADGLGTGLAQLPQRAPRIAAYIEQRIAALAALARP